MKKKNLLSLVAVGAFMVLAVASSKDKSSSSSSSFSSSSSASASDSPKAKPKPKENWDYGESTDEMTNKDQFWTTTTSTNTIDFDFPYQGGSTFDLTVRNLGKKNEVTLSVSKGQFLTSFGFSKACMVKFDDETGTRFSYGSASDGSSDIIFFSNASKFISRLKKAKKLKIEAPFFNEGNKIIEFDVAGLKWEH